MLIDDHEILNINTIKTTWVSLRTTDIKHIKGRTSPDEMEMFKVLSHRVVSHSLQLCGP